MGPTDIAAWGQTDLPTEATAIFPPGHVPAANPPTDFEWASLHYFNASGQQVNVAAQNASGDYSIGTTEYDEFGNVVRSLTPSARDYAIANGVTAGEALAIAQVVDTRLVFADDGIELLDVYGPQHQLQLDDGSIVDGRLHKHITYDEGAPSGSGGPFHLATTVTDGVLVEGETVDTDLRVSTTTYDWDLLEPVTQTTDPGGLELVTRAEYDPATGGLTSSFMPGNPSGGDASETDYVYFTGDASSAHSSCDNAPEWVGLLCRVQPAAQPQSGTALPVFEYTYDMWGNAATIDEQTPGTSSTRTWNYTYDDAGRSLSVSVSGDGTAVPNTEFGYDADTGLLETTTAGTATITRTYDAAGRLSDYSDASGVTSSMAYDLRDRLVSRDDGKGTMTFGYDEDRSVGAS